MLQETHSAPQDSSFWQAEWGAPIMFYHGPNTCEAGVAIMLPRSLAGRCNATVSYDSGNGRLLILNIDYGQVTIALFAAYALTQSHAQEQVTFLTLLQTKLRDLMPEYGGHILLAGDFNLHLSKLDVQNCRFRLSQAGQLLNDILSNMSLVDVWRDRYKERTRYTWRRYVQ